MPHSFLVIDDSKTARSIIKKILQTEFSDCSVVEAEDGKLGIRELSKSRVDVIFTDLEMDGMDGGQFLELIRKNPVLSKKPIIVTSSAITEELKGWFADMKNVFFLPKNKLRDDLVTTAKEALGKK